MSLRLATFSRGIAKQESVHAMLGATDVVLAPKSAEGIDAVVGWGLKDNTIPALEFAHRHQLPLWRLEDGFLRSVGLGVEGDEALSIVVDEDGMYYDARRPSRLERLLQEETAELADDVFLARAEAARKGIVEAGLSKYNQTPPDAPFLHEPHSGRRVLVVDQTFGDLSVATGLASAESFSQMLEAARVENPGAEILVKTHPDVLSGKKRGYLPPEIAGADVRLLTEPVNPVALVSKVDEVYCVTSQLGFEAAMVGKTVHCFGVPFYAGWGITRDRCEVPRRRRQRSLVEVFAAAYLLYPRYLHPARRDEGEVEDVIEHLALQRREHVRNQGRIYCFGFRPWKHNYVRAYLRCPGNQILFADSTGDALAKGMDASCRLLAWGQRESETVNELVAALGVAHERMEDGFLRSVGLGSDLSVPASLVVDSKGIYYDPTEPSELEEILQTHRFSEELLTRARRFREELLAKKVSKYNVGVATKVWVPAGRKVVLVPGQVEDDASIVLGCRSIRTNLGLLEAARQTHPDAYLIFKPHPDVLSGNRHGAVDANDAIQYCDRIEEDATLPECLDAVQAVHTMTSLVGFEGLLRGLEVHCMGQPFYSGWGLTIDLHPVARRTRLLSIDELVAGVYFLYPRYLDRSSMRFTTPEAVLDELAVGKARGEEPFKVTRTRRRVRKLRHIVKGVLRGA